MFSGGRPAECDTHTELWERLDTNTGRIAFHQVHGGHHGSTSDPIGSRAGTKHKIGKIGWIGAGSAYSQHLLFARTRYAVGASHCRSVSFNWSKDTGLLK